MEDPQVKYFVCATIRILGAWLSEETQALREDVYEIVPFIFELANETFEAQKISKLSVLPGRGSACNFTPETALNNLQKEGKMLPFFKKSIKKLTKYFFQGCWKQRGRGAKLHCPL